MNDTTAPVRRRKPKGRKAIIFVVMLALAGGGWYGWHHYKAGKSKEGEYLTTTVTRGDIEDLVTSTGKLQPRDYVDVGAQVSGQIEKIYVEVGDVVQAGDKLADIDATTAAAQVDKLEAQLLSAQTSLEDSKNSLDKAKRDYDRQVNLYAAEATTKETLMNADTSLTSAKNRIKTQEASIAVQAADLKIQKRNLDYTRIVAPIAGTVMSLAVKQGQTVNASQNVPKVLQIADLSTMTVQSEVSEADIGKLYTGIQVYFTTLNSNRRWYGELRRIEPTPKESNSVVLYNALFDVQNEVKSDGSTTLRPQSTAQVYFVSAEVKDVLMVPMNALTQGSQISRELQQKEREKNGGKAVAGGPAGGMPGGAPGAPGAARGAPGAAGSAAGATAPAAATEGATATVAGNATTPSAGSAPGAGSAPPAAAGQGNRQGGGFGNRQGGGGFGNRQANAQGGSQGNRQGGTQGEGQGNRQGMRAGQPGAGGFNGPRLGATGGQGGAGAQGGPGGGQGRFNNMTQEERDRMMAQMRQGGGGVPGGGNRSGGFGGQRGGGMGGFNAMGSTGGTAAGQRPAQRRNGTVMVKLADGSLEVRRIVYGVTNRVQAEVLEGLKEGEEIVIGKREAEAAAAAPRNNNNNFNNNNNNNFQNNRGGGNFNGGGGRPF